MRSHLGQVGRGSRGVASAAWVPEMLAVGPVSAALVSPPAWGCLPVRSLRLPGLSLHHPDLLASPSYSSVTCSLPSVSLCSRSLCPAPLPGLLLSPPLVLAHHLHHLLPLFPASSAGAGGDACGPILPDGATPPPPLSGCVSTPIGPGIRRNTFPGRAAASASQPHQRNHSPRGQAHPDAH